MTNFVLSQGTRQISLDSLYYIKVNIYSNEVEGVKAYTQ